MLAIGYGDGALAGARRIRVNEIEVRLCLRGMEDRRRVKQRGIYTSLSFSSHSMPSLTPRSCPSHTPIGPSRPSSHTLFPVGSRFGVTMSSIVLMVAVLRPSMFAAVRLGCGTLHPQLLRRCEAGRSRHPRYPAPLARSVRPRHKLQMGVDGQKEQVLTPDSPILHSAVFPGFAGSAGVQGLGSVSRQLKGCIHVGKAILSTNNVA